MKGFIKKAIDNDKIRYLFVGGCTTVVNFATMFLLRTFTDLPRNTANVIAIICAIVFAYFANKFIVFKSKTNSFVDTVRETLCFFGGRILAMGVEVIGFSILCDTFRIRELFSKVAVQFVVIVFNYVFSKLFVFKKERRGLREKFADNYCYYITFAIVFVVMAVIFISEKIAPFGTHSLTLIDSIHQYVPFYSEFRDKLLNEGSLFYSWNIALGSNFMSLSAYYLSSPFNLLFLLFGKEQIVAVACVIIAIKICLCGVSMTHFLSYYSGEKKRSITIIAISVAYALNNYVVGYNWNTMWLDCLIAFPLIMLGFMRMMEKKDCKLYIISLFYALYCNYYIGYIICLFLVLWFITYNHKGFVKFIKDGFYFAISSMIAGGMAMFLLLPAYFGIMSTAAGKMKLPKFSWYGNIFVMIKQQFLLTNPITNQTFDGGVNLFCGTLCVIAMFLYFLVGNVKIYDKLQKLVLLALLMVSFNETCLNYIWHGMHDQYGIPNRFSFLFVFILFVMLYETFNNFDTLNVPLVIAGIMFTISLVLACYMYVKLDKRVLVATIIMLVIYSIILCLGASKKLKLEAFYYVISGVFVLEMLISGIYGLLDNGYTDAASYYATSPEVTKAVAYVKEIADEDYDGFYRAELMKSTVLDEVTWHNMPSVGTFCSTVLGGTVTAMGELGFYTGANEFLYMGCSPLTNTMLNVRYLLEREGDLNNFPYNYVAEVENVGIYENKYPLSLGFGVSNDIKEWTYSANRLKGQKELGKAMADVDDFFTLVEPAFIVESEDCDTEIHNDNIYYTPHHSGKVSYKISFYIDDPGDYYVDCRGNYINKVRFYIDGEEYAYDRYQTQIFHLGELEQDQYVTVEYIYRDVDTSEKTGQLYVAKFNENRFEELYDKLKLSKFEVKEYKDGYVKGSIKIDDNQTMFTSIPYDEGWTLYVDGKKHDYYCLLKGFIGIDLEKGSHRIEMKYVPKGIYLGIILSVLSWISYILIVLLDSVSKKPIDGEDKADEEEIQTIDTDVKIVDMENVEEFEASEVTDEIDTDNESETSEDVFEEIVSDEEAVVEDMEKTETTSEKYLEPVKEIDEEIKIETQIETETGETTPDIAKESLKKMSKEEEDLIADAMKIADAILSGGIKK